MKPQPCIVFRADGSARIGMGHIMRCLTLADEMAIWGAKCIFVVRGSQPWIVELGESSPHQFLTLPKPVSELEGTTENEYAAWLGTTETLDAEETLSLLEDNLISPDICIADHYALGCEWEDVVQRSTGARICVIDDLDRSHNCDVLIDTTFGKTQASYADKVPDSCEILTGASYAMLRPRFAQLRPQALARRDADYASEQPVRELLIAMGGADDADATAWMLAACSTICSERSLKMTILVGGAYPHRTRLLQKAESAACEVEVLYSIDDVAPVLARADLAIGAAGSSSWERCCMGLPTIILVLADNQRIIAEQLTSTGAAFGTDEIDLNQLNGVQQLWSEKNLLPILDCLEKLRKVSNRSIQITDGNGVKRVAQRVLFQHQPENKLVEDHP